MSEPDVWHLPATTIEVARALDPAAWERLERIEAVVGIPPESESKKRLLTPNWTARRASYEDWQDRVAVTLALAPIVTAAYVAAWAAHQAHLCSVINASLREMPAMVDP